MSKQYMIPRYCDVTLAESCFGAIAGPAMSEQSGSEAKRAAAALTLVWLDTKMWILMIFWNVESLATWMHRRRWIHTSKVMLRRESVLTEETRKPSWSFASLLTGFPELCNWKRHLGHLDVEYLGLWRRNAPVCVRFQARMEQPGAFKIMKGSRLLREWWGRIVYNKDDMESMSYKSFRK